jgi:hypothetical protein
MWFHKRHTVTAFMPLLTLLLHGVSSCEFEKRMEGKLCESSRCLLLTQINYERRHCHRLRACDEAGLSCKNYTSFLFVLFERERIDKVTVNRHILRNVAYLKQLISQACHVVFVHNFPDIMYKVQSCHCVW